MSFASPLALLLLVPYAAVAVLVWRRRRTGRATGVPFLALWDRSAATSRPEVERPPWPVWLTLLATLLMLLAAAEPLWDWGVRRQVKLELVQAPDADVADALATLADEADVKLTVAQTSTVDSSRVASVAFARQRDGATVVVAGAADRVREGDRLRRLPPVPRAAVGIGGLSRSSDGRIAVELWRTAEADASLDLTVAGRVVAVDFGKSLTALMLVDGPSGPADDVIRVTIGAAAARLVRVNPWPDIDVRTDLSPAEERMIRAIRGERVPTAASELLAVVGPDDAETAGRAIVLPTLDDAAAAVALRPAVALPPIDWDRFRPFRVARMGPPGDDWRPVLVAGERPVVAVREGPGGARQAWVGLSSPALEADVAYVQMWGALHGWLSRGGERWEARGLTRPPAVAGAGERERFVQWLSEQAVGRRLDRPLALLALALLATAAGRLGR